MKRKKSDWNPILVSAIAIIIVLSILMYSIEASVKMYFIVIGAILFISTIIDLNRKSDIILEERNIQLKEIRQKLEAIPNFNKSKTIKFRNSFISIDETQRKIAVKDKLGNKVYSFDKLIDYEIVIEGNNENEKKGVVKRAIIGGLLAGGAGAVIGGLTAKEKTIEKVKNLHLQLKFSDINKPLYKISFFDSKDYPFSEDGVKVNEHNEYKESLAKLKQWVSILDVILNENKTKKNQDSNNSPSFIAEELSKLNDLKEKGILSEIEFQKQKNKLLNL